jgi:hypothetical protein
MRVGMHTVGRCASVATLVILVTAAGVAPVGASGGPKAGLSINGARKGLAVTFVARSSGFSAPVHSYAWTFGDGRSTTTSTPTVTHTYAAASTYSPSLTETDTSGATASATGTLGLFDCAAGQSQCSEALAGVGTVALLQASGPTGAGAPAGVDLFVGPFRIPDCGTGIAQAVALSDSGFSGSLTVTLQYTTSQPKHADTTCFSSQVPFVDASGQTVHNGPLPTCQGTPGPPCVQSIEMSGATVSKVLLIPPGDPKVGAP